MSEEMSDPLKPCTDSNEALHSVSLKTYSPFSSCRVSEEGSTSEVAPQPVTMD